MSNIDLKGKKLLVLGGSFASTDVVKNAHEMGLYVVVADISDKGPAYKMADEGVRVSTVDMDGLEKVIKEKNIDGVFCGPSEFNIFNVMKLCKRAGLPFYGNEKLWHQCADKLQFRSFCKRNGLDVPMEYNIDDDTDFNTLCGVEYPVIVKPIDGCSSKGITVCRNNEELKDAYAKAKANSASGKVIVEQYIESNGRGFTFYYMVQDGKAYPYLLEDTFIADPIRKKCMISAFFYAPSDISDAFLKTVDANVQKMLTDMGIKNGTIFIQARPYKGKFYCHDMGYRLSGVMSYKLSEPLIGLNDMKMMIRYALGGNICENEDIEKLKNIGQIKNIVIQVPIPLDAGTIACIKGVDEVSKLPEVCDVLQIYNEGDTIEEAVIGTIGQHFIRFTLSCKDKSDAERIVRFIGDSISVKDTNGNEMFNMRFDYDRTKQNTFFD